MQLDKTQISIRERTLPEIMDLALQVIRVHAVALLAMFALGAVPMILLNTWLIGDWVVTEFDEDWSQGYIWLMIFLVALETPLATAPTTLYLGQVMFQDRWEVRRLVTDFFRGLPQLFWYQIVARGIFVVPSVVLVLPLLAPYAIWPYLSEVILLERNPMFRGRERRLTTYRRSKVLHTAASGDLFARWMLSTIAGIPMIVAMWMSLWMLQSMLTGVWHSQYVGMVVYLQVAVWLVVDFFAVVRFLAYLDQRIRREGWEVELSMRAEAARLARHMA